MTPHASVTKDGKPFTDYQWCEETKTFSTTESRLVLDFSGVHGVTFKTGSHCTFKTGNSCTFKTGNICTFNTGNSCTFNTGSACTFNTGSHCTFNTGSHCTFNTGNICTFKTGNSCTFKTGYGCTFHTGFSCTFNTGYYCIFKTDKNCVGIRYDVDGIIEIPPNTLIKYNGCASPGYTIIEPKHTIIIDGKEIELSEESYQSLKKSLITD